MSRSLASQFRPSTFGKQPQQLGQTLIGLLVVIAIIGILAVIMIPKIAGRHHSPGQPLTPRERGYQAACGAYEAQINQAIMMYRDDHNHNPPSLDALKRYGLTDEMIHAPDCVFLYDPQTGIARNAAEGAQGVGGVVNPTSPEQLESGAGSSSAASQPQSSSPYGAHTIAPPGSMQPRQRGNSMSPPDSGAQAGGQTQLPGGLHMPNVGGGMGGGADLGQ
ncbi:MAG TPA: prepilin-type N-terminal cleavage/methylation domain-containing protein [Capsulimonadaceae bacterium]|nr:prepilin-type N-terminal cleavage/methylation domain-containing protein [Capsulimonadaceae bacterium]